MATVFLPYTDPVDRRQFASIHSNPPGVPTGYPAVVQQSFGAGTVVWAAGVLEADGRGPQTDLFVQLALGAGGDEVSLQALAPRNVEVRIVDQPQHNRLVVSLVSLATDSPPLAVPPGHIDIFLAGKKATQARTVPAGRAVPLELRDGRARVRFDAFQRFQMLELAYDDT
jgi:hypothetical protein